MNHSKTQMRKERVHALHLQGYTAGQIAHEEGITVARVYQIKRELRLEKGTPGPKKNNAIRAEVTHYHAQGKTAQQIADLLGVSRPWIYTLLQELQLKSPERHGAIPTVEIENALKAVLSSPYSNKETISEVTNEDLLSYYFGDQFSIPQVRLARQKYNRDVQAGKIKPISVVQKTTADPWFSQEKLYQGEDANDLLTYKEFFKKFYYEPTDADLASETETETKGLN